MASYELRIRLLPGQLTEPVQLAQRPSLLSHPKSSHAQQVCATKCGMYGSMKLWGM